MFVKTQTTIQTLSEYVARYPADYQGANMHNYQLLEELFFYQGLCLLLGLALCVVILIVIGQSLYIDSFKRDHWWR